MSAEGGNDGILFVTGMQRSGTTLLEKLLCRHPEVSVLSQPFPLFFVETKGAFLRELGEPPERYPLGHLFLETRYGTRQLADFLGRHRASSARLRELFARMEDYSGQYTRFGPAELEAAFARLDPDGDFLDTLAGLYRALAHRPGARVLGGKETVCEEYLPYLAAGGCRCVLLLRDPRDVLASLNHGRGQEHGGRLKPTLFNLRNWRKSVAFVLHLDGHPGFQWLRYEDLVADPLAALGRIAHAFGLGPVTAEIAGGEIRDRSDQVWKGNSSYGEHRGVSTSSVGAHRGVLPSAVARFVEAACLPEMRLLGYPAGLDPAEAPDVLRSFREPYAIAREGMERDAAGPDNAALEVRRLELLGEAPGSASVPWFLFERAHARLREALPA